MKAAIFDLDGTLIDSLQDIAQSMNQVLEELGFPAHELQEYNYFVGDGALILTQNALPKDTSQEVINQVLQRFKEVYDLGIHHQTKPYEGIIEVLEELHQEGIRLGILSNKPHEFTIKYTQNLFSHIPFEEVHGQKNNVEKKPHPAGALHIAKQMNLDPSEICFIGDTATDMKTASNANMKSIGVLWGFRPKEELEEHGAHFLAKTPSDIAKIILNLRNQNA